MLVGTVITAALVDGLVLGLFLCPLAPLTHGIAHTSPHTSHPLGCEHSKQSLNVGVAFSS